jgi:hypothetical protein
MGELLRHLSLLADVPGVQRCSLLRLHGGALVEVLGQVGLIEASGVDHLPLRDVVLLQIGLNHLCHAPWVLLQKGLHHRFLVGRLLGAEGLQLFEDGWREVFAIVVGVVLGAPRLPQPIGQLGQLPSASTTGLPLFQGTIASQQVRTS